MSKEKQIQEYESKQLIDELSKMPPMVIATAYLHAINYTLYGEDVTEKWVTATEQTAILEKAYRKGYYDAMQRQAESVEKGARMIDICFDCKYYVDGMCTQYDIVVAPTDGCSNGEKGEQDNAYNKISR